MAVGPGTRGPSSRRRLAPSETERGYGCSDAPVRGGRLRRAARRAGPRQGMWPARGRRDHGQAALRRDGARSGAALRRRTIFGRSQRRVLVDRLASPTWHGFSEGAGGATLCPLCPLASKAAAVGKGAGGRQIYKPNYFFRNASTTNSSETPVSVFCTALSSGDRFACARPRGGRAIRESKW